MIALPPFSLSSPPRDGFSRPATAVKGETGGRSPRSAASRNGRGFQRAWRAALDWAATIILSGALTHRFCYQS